MSLQKIKSAFETKLNTLTPTLQTSYENVPFTPTTGTPYQQIDFLWSENVGQYINEKDYLVKGICQIMLCYPSNKGMGDINARVQLLLDTFYFGSTLTKDNLKINISGVPEVRNLGLDNTDSRVKISVRVAFRCML